MEPGDLLTVAAAARALTGAGDRITRQGLSKYCEAHGLKLETPAGPRVSLSAVRAHRKENYQREVMTGGAQIPETPEPPPPAAPSAAAARPAPPPPEDTVIALDPSRRLKQLQVEAAELTTAKLRGELVLVDEVTAGIAEAVILMRQHMLQSISDQAQQLAAELSLGGEDERIIRGAWKAKAREDLARFVSAAAASLAAMTAEPETDARRRILALAIASARMRRRPERLVDALEARRA